MHILNIEVRIGFCLITELRSAENASIEDGVAEAVEYILQREASFK